MRICFCVRPCRQCRMTGIQHSIIIIIIIITAYTAPFLQSGSSSAGIPVISASNVGQAGSTGEIPLLFSRSAVTEFFKVPCIGLAEEQFSFNF